MTDEPEKPLRCSECKREPREDEWHHKARQIAQMATSSATTTTARTARYTVIEGTGFPPVWELKRAARAAPHGS